MSISCCEQQPIAASRSPTEAFRVLLAVILLLGLMGTAVIRNARWYTLLTIWEDCAKKSPNKSRTHNNLGNCHLLLGRHFPAISEYEKAVLLEPGNMEAQYNLATTLDAIGLYNKAVRPYELFCQFAPPELAQHRAKACGRLQELVDLARTGTPGTERQ